MIVGSGAKMLDGLSARREGRPNEALCDVAWHAIRAFDAARPLISRSCVRMDSPVRFCPGRAMKRASPTGPAALHESTHGPSVWTGRALQAESDDLEVVGLALLYPAL